MKKIFIASDHAGFILKGHIFNSLKNKFKIIDLGTKTDTESVNYPDYAHKLCKQALCYSANNAKLSRLHNDANVITLGERLTNKSLAMKCVNIFLKTKFEGGRHLKRVRKI